MNNLTERELEVLKYLLIGLNNKEISEKTVTTVHTVKAHLTSIMKKLSVTNRTAAVYKAIKNKIVDIDEN